MTAAQMSDDRPIGEVNTTPLIDVMLVLLVMFIITIPIQTHSVPVDLPVGPRLEIEVHHDRNKLVVLQNGALLWNGQPVDMDGLRGALARVAGTQPQPELQFEPHSEARYDVVSDVMGLIKRANVRLMGFVGNERYADF